MTTISDRTSPEARQKCWDARDAYFRCLGENDEQKDKCIAFKQDFDNNCLSSWVKHFEESRAYKMKISQQYRHIQEQGSKK